MEFRILGPLEVIGHEGIPLPLPRGRGRALLAVLILHAGQVVSSDRLIDDLWGEDQPATATTALQGLVLGLRKRLEPLRSKGVAPSILQTRSPGYLLAIDDDQVDALRFRRLLKEAAGSTVPERTAILQAALGLWRGPALTDFTYQPFAQMEITALDELRITAVEERIDADLTSGRHGGLVSELESLVAEYPLREGLQGQLMLALYRAGRQAEALDLYRNLRQTLVEELGVEPGPALQALEGAILRQDPSLDPPLPETPGRTGLAAQMSDAHDSPWLPPGRKTVTVVFADLAPIDIDGEIDPEARRMITRRGYDIAASAFTRHGGTVEGLIGDVVVAVFGVPVAHEDDALRGVRAALEFQEQLRELNERLDSGLGSKLAARVGIATGEVVVGGPGIGGPSTSGGTVNIAARLQQTAATEEVLVGEATRRLVEDVARVESVGLIASGLPAWRVTGLVAHSAAVVRDAETLIVGRDAELAQLGTLFDEMVRSRRAVLVRVLGEAGIGKSRLVREFATPVARQALVLTGHCPAYGKEITFWSLREIVLQALDTTGANSIADLMTSGDAVPIAAQLAGAIGLTEEPVRRQGLFQAFRRLLEELARKQPVVVIFEDVHWAQSTLLDLVDYLADSIHEPTMLVCVARPELLDRHRAWTGPGPSLLVGPLGPGDSEKLLADRISDRTLSKDLASQVLEAAQGNPLFVEQLAAALHDDGTLAIPATVDALLSARLDSLGPAERDLLRCASVVGMEFSAEVLRALVPAEARPFVVRHLEALRDKELIASTDRRFLASPAWTFRHTLIQLAAYRSTTRQARSELHERFAGWLESEKPPGSVGYDEILGHHLEQAFLDRRHLGLSDDHTKSLAVAAGERLAEAGLRALAKFDAAAAESLLARAMALIPSTHPSRSEVGSRMAEAYTIMGHHRDADAVLAELQKTLVPGDNKTGRFIRIERAGILLATGPDPVSLEAIRHEASQVLAASEQARDEEGIAHSLFVLAVVHFRAGEFGAMEKLARRNIAHADRSGIAREELGARLVLALALESGPVPVSEAIRELELVVRWRNTEHPSLLSTLAHLRAMIGEFDQARELIFRSRRLLMEQTPARRPLGLLSEHGAAVEITAGDLVAAERHLREGLELNLSMGERERVALVAAILSGILAGRADHREVMRMASLSRDQAPSESVVAQARWRAAMARAMANHHDSKEAEQFARQALDLVTADMLNLAAEFRLNLAEILMKGPRDDEIRRLIDEAVVLYKRKGNLVGAARARSLDPRQAVHE